MHGFDRTYGVGAPFSFHAFNKPPGPNDLIHIFEPLGKDDCEQLSHIVCKADCWVRISPKVGHKFENMSWLEHLWGCSKLWLDLSEDCKITVSDIQGLNKDVKSLLLPYRSGATYSKVSFQELSQLESLTISGTFKNLAFLECLVNLRELKMFRVKVCDLASIGNLSLLEVLVIERSSLDSLKGLEHAKCLKSISLLDTRIKESCDLSKCLGVEHLEMVFSRIGGTIELPNSKIKYLRIISVNPAISLASSWAISSLEFLANDAGHLELQGGFLPIHHKSLKQLYVGPMEGQDAFKLSKVLGVKVAGAESEMPSTFK
jgi:hypothetical protein